MHETKELRKKDKSLEQNNYRKFVRYKEGAEMYGVCLAKFQQIVCRRERVLILCHLPATLG